jgi:phosphatidylserine synthase
MLSSALRKTVRPALASVGASLARLGAHGNLVTTVAFVIGLGAIPAIATHNYLIGLVLIVLNRVLDAMKGAIARQGAARPLGQFLGMTFDLIFFAGLPFGFALADPGRGLAAAFFVFAIAASAASALAFTVVSEETGAALAPGGYTALGYLARLMEDSELFLAFALACVMPAWFSVIAYIVGILCFITAGARITGAVARFGGP